MTTKISPLELLKEATTWIEKQNPGLAAGIKTPAHALRLYRYWQQHQTSSLHLPAYADGRRATDAMARVQAIGYDPLKARAGQPSTFELVSSHPSNWPKKNKS